MKFKSIKYFVFLFFIPLFAHADGLSGVFGSFSSPETAIQGAFINLAPVIGTLSIIMIMYGGFLYMTANGDPKRAAKGREYIIYVLIGVAIYVGANLILTAVGAQGL
jgi:hypothetical protein